MLLNYSQNTAFVLNQSHQENTEMLEMPHTPYTQRREELTGLMGIIFERIITKLCNTCTTFEFTISLTHNTFL